MRGFRLTVLLLLAVCLSMTSWCARAYAASASANYERFESLFLQGQYAAVVNESDAIARSGYGRKDEVYYLKGLSQLKIKKYADARASFGYIESNLSRSKRLFDARLGIGDSYMLEGDLNAAAGVYNRMINEFPSNKNLPEVYARLASCYSGLGMRDKAAVYEAMARKAAPYSFGAKIQAQQSGRQSGQPVSGSTNAAPATNAFSVQTGSFKSRKNASKFAQELASRGYESRVEMPVSRSDRLYRVKIGRYASKSDAQAMAGRLQRDGYKTAICSNDVCE